MMQLNPARKATESYSAYQKRRASENAKVARHLRGRLVVDCGVRFIPHPTTGAMVPTNGHPFGAA